MGRRGFTPSFHCCPSDVFPRPVINLLKMSFSMVVCVNKKAAPFGAASQIAVVISLLAHRHLLRHMSLCLVIYQRATCAQQASQRLPFHIIWLGPVLYKLLALRFPFTQNDHGFSHFKLLGLDLCSTNQARAARPFSIGTAFLARNSVSSFPQQNEMIPCLFVSPRLVK